LVVGVENIHIGVFRIGACTMMMNSVNEIVNIVVFDDNGWNDVHSFATKNGMDNDDIPFDISYWIASPKGKKYS
jgi:hypothetical protein